VWWRWAPLLLLLLLLLELLLVMHAVLLRAMTLTARGQQLDEWQCT
jgi:hypothetical protein